MNRVTGAWHSWQAMKTPAERLRAARIEAGYRSSMSASKAFGWTHSTYAAHENGQNDFDGDAATRYARAFRTSAGYLLTGERNVRARIKTVPLVGHVGAGAQAFFAAGQGPFDEVEAPEGSTDETVAVEIRGDSLGSLFDRWLVFYDDVHDPPTRDLIGKLCVCGLADGRVLIKKLMRGQIANHFTLLSNIEPPIYDVMVEWAARVKTMTPK